MPAGHWEACCAGAIATGGVRVLNDDVIAAAGVTPAKLAEVTGREEEELREREQLYRGDLPALALDGRTVELARVATPSPFRAVGYWYRAFAAVSDEDVRRLLARAAG
jgi:predicted phosphoribosyltransferase